jgi:hypothetical protein
MRRGNLERNVTEGNKNVAFTFRAILLVTSEALATESWYNRRGG